MDIQNNQTQELFEKLYVKNAPSWALERDSDGSYKYHATQSAFSLFEQQQAEIELLKSDLAKAQAVPETQQALNYRLLVKSIREHVESHIAEISVNDLFDKGWLAAMKCIQNNIDMLEAQEPAND